MIDNHFTEGTRVMTDVEGFTGYVGEVVRIDLEYTSLGAKLETHVVFPEHPDQKPDTVFVFYPSGLRVVGQPPHVHEWRRRRLLQQEIPA